MLTPLRLCLCSTWHDSCFRFNGHMCLVFEALGSSLYDYVRMNNFKPLPLKCVQAFSQQLLISLRFLHKQRLVHTDLKPENILLTRCSFHDSWAVTKERTSRRVCEPDKLDIKCKWVLCSHCDGSVVV